MSDDSPFYDITEGEWRVTARPAASAGDAVIEFFHNDELFRSRSDYPAYRVWNIAAHFRDIIEGFEAELSSVSQP